MNVTVEAALWCSQLEGYWFDLVEFTCSPHVCMSNAAFSPRTKTCIWGMEIEIVLQCEWLFVFDVALHCCLIWGIPHLLPKDS